MTNGTFYTVGEVGRWTNNPQEDNAAVVTGGIPGGTITIGGVIFTYGGNWPAAGNDLLRAQSLVTAILSDPILQGLNVGAYIDTTTIAPGIIFHIVGPNGVPAIADLTGWFGPWTTTTSSFSTNYPTGIPGVTIDNGRSLTSHSKAPASATAIWIAEYASLHCPISSSRGIPPISPNASLLKRYFPHASVKITQSSGTA